MSASTFRQPLLRGPLRYATAVSTCTLPLLLSCAYAVCAIAWRDRLPAAMATHFGGSGTPDDWSSRATALWVDSAIVAAFLLVLLGITLAGLARGGAGRLLAAVLSGAAGAVTVISILTLYVQLDGRDPRLGWPILFAAAAAIVCAAVTLATFPARETEWRPRPSKAERRGPETPLRASETVAFFGSQHAHASLLAAMLGAIAATTLVAGGFRLPFLFVAIAACLLVLLMTTYVRVRVDRSGFTWILGPGIARSTVPLADIESVEAISIRPLENGGWGYRGSKRGRLGIIVRGGPAIRLGLTEGRTLTVSLSDPEGAAETVRQLRQALPAEPPTRR